MATVQEETGMSRARDRMVDRQIAARGVRDSRVLMAMRRVPREAFVYEGAREFAYEDSPLPIGEGQTISQPYIVAFMLEAAEISPADRVLEIGAGSGYAAAVAAQLAAEVCAVERHASLVAEAQQRFKRLGYRNITLRHADGTKGWPNGGAFDAIVVSAGGSQIPSALKSQLKIGGRLVIPLGAEDEPQELLKLTRRSATKQRIFHDAGVAQCLLDLSRNNPATRALRSSRLERFIGVIYRPATELQSHYAESSLAQQFDAFLWFDEKRGVTPLAPAHVKPGLPDTYPFGL